MGVATHLNVPLWSVRLTWAFLGLAGGAGVAVYIFLWVTIPAGDPAQASADARPASLSRLAPRVRGQVTRLPIRDVAIGIVLLSAAAVLIAVRMGVDVQVSWTLPLVIAIAGTALAWSQLDEVERGRLITRAGGRKQAGLLRIVGGVVLVTVGVVLLVGQDAEPADVLRATVASVAVLAGAAIALAPWWLRLVRELGDERMARAREAERADIAAHLHDSVLQTLSLIRTRAAEPDAVARLARAQERELREWLYDDRPSPGTSLAAELRGLIGEVEDGRIGRAPAGGGTPSPVAIDTVIVGDCAPTQETTALLQATREALVNAVAHGRAPISVYLEVSAEAVDVFIRDRGDGFRMDEIADDRFGVRESILGRIRRRGGSAEVESRPDWGTEVRLRVPRKAEADHVPEEQP